MFYPEGGAVLYLIMLNVLITRVLAKEGTVKWQEVPGCVYVTSDLQKLRKRGKVVLGYAPRRNEVVGPISLETSRVNAARQAAATMEDKPQTALKAGLRRRSAATAEVGPRFRTLAGKYALPLYQGVSRAAESYKSNAELRVRAKSSSVNGVTAKYSQSFPELVMQRNLVVHCRGVLR